MVFCSNSGKLHHLVETKYLAGQLNGRGYKPDSVFIIKLEMFLILKKINMHTFLLKFGWSIHVKKLCCL